MLTQARKDANVVVNVRDAIQHKAHCAHEKNEDL